MELPWWLRWWSVCLQCGRPRFDPWVGKISWRRKWQPTSVFLPGKFHGWRSLVGYSPWDRKESNTTERLQCQRQRLERMAQFVNFCINSSPFVPYLTNQYILSGLFSSLWNTDHVFSSMCPLLLIHHFTAVSLHSYTFFYRLSFLSISSCIPHHGWYYLNPLSTKPFQNHSKKESEVAQLCPTLCNPMDGSLPGSSVHGVLKASKLEWVAITFSRGSSRPRGQTQVSHIAGGCFPVWATREALQNHIGSLLSGLTYLLCHFNTFCVI